MTILSHTSSSPSAVPVIPAIPADPAITPPRPSPLATALRLAGDPASWRPLVDFDPDRRYFRRLVADEHHEAWLLTWLPGQGTDWHDHGGSGGALVLLQGALVERTAVHGLVRGSRRVHRQGGSRAFGSDHVHRVTNESPDPAISLHVYAPRLQLQHDYAEDGGILRRTATRRAGRDW